MKQQDYAEEQPRRALTEELGEPVADNTWNYLIKKRYVEEYINGYISIEELANEYKEVRNAGSSEKSATLPQSNLPVSERPEILEGQASEDTRYDLAFSFLVARQVDEVPEVKAFRKEVLGGSLVPFAELENWLHNTQAQDEPVVHWLEVPLGDVSPEELLEWQRNGLPALVPVSQGPERLKLRLSTFSLAYPGEDGWAKAIPINPVGVMGRLKDLCDSIIKYHAPAWDEGSTVAFVLSGKVPLIPQIRYRARVTSQGGPVWITATFDARTPQQTLAKHFAPIRNRLIGSRGRRVGTKGRELVLFAAKHKTKDVVWREVMNLWNEEHKHKPAWQYDNYRRFHRDTTRAQKSMLEGSVNLAALVPKPKE